MNKHVTIIGAGIGGLATALRLTTLGYKVTILEKYHQAGGRLNQIKKDGFTFDTGPSFFSMSYEFQEFAKDCGMKLPFEIVELDPLYTVHFDGSDRKYLFYKDIHKLAQQFVEFEPDFEEKMNRYLKKCGELFHDTVDIVIKRNFNSIPEYLLALAQVNPKHIPVLWRTFSAQVDRYFTSTEAKYIVSLVAFFLGRTPFDTAAVYTLLSYTEFVHDGYYNVKGGMYKIIEGFVDELKKRGVDIHYNVEIKGFNKTKGKLNSVVDAQGKTYSSDIFVANADAALFRGTVLKRKAFSEQKLLKKEWTMGYLTIYLGINKKLPEVHHHNYFLGNNFNEYARDVQRDPNSLDKPYYYVNVLSKHNAECAPEGCESLFFVCPVPNLIYKKDWSDRDKIVNSIIDDFGKRIGEDIASSVVSKSVFTPENWQSNFNLFKGSGLGLSHSLMQIGGFRPSNKDEEFKNLFYVGASTTPGAGIPMAIISSKLCADRVKEYGAKE